MISHPQTHILYYRMSQKISTHTFTYTVEPNICRKMSADKEKIFPDLFSWFWLFGSFKLAWLCYRTIYTACSMQWVYPTFLSNRQRKYTSQQEVQPVNWDGMIQGWTYKWFFLCDSWKAASLLCCSCRRCTVQAKTWCVSWDSFTPCFHFNFLITLLFVAFSWTFLFPKEIVPFYNYITIKRTE